jgi:hypothetical protein
MVWTPTVAGIYKVRVYVRTVGSAALYEKSALRVGYQVVEQAPVTAVALNVDRGSPQQVGAPLTFTAAASVDGVVGTHEYQFWLSSKTGGAYELVRDYQPEGFWSPDALEMGVPDSYVVKACARNVGSASACEKYATREFVTTTAAPVSAMRLTVSPTAPGAAGVPVRFTASATPGTPGGAVEYQFWFCAGASGPYVAVGDATTGYSPASSWTWTPAGAGSYRVMVYARTPGSVAPYEKFRTADFTVN